MVSLAGLIEERLDRGKVRNYSGDRVVMTGGASQLVGIGEFMANTMGRPVRVARPSRCRGCRKVFQVPRSRPLQVSSLRFLPEPEA